MSEAPLRVLVVDDSAFARKVVVGVLGARTDIAIVGTARDGLEALEKIEELSPEVITLDLVMPHLDGVGLLQALQPDGPSVVIVSMSDRETALAVRALELGAFDLVHKPTPLATDRLYEMGDELVLKVRAAGAHKRRRGIGVVPAAFTRIADGRRASIVCIGCSTGGPQALTRLIPQLPASLPVPVCVAVHMPPGFTESLAQRLDSISAVHVVEARDGMRLEPGTVAIAPGGTHMRITRGDHPSVRIVPVSATDGYRPSVDILFESAVQAAGNRVLAVVLTGMGDDGLRGARAVIDAGGRVLTESAGSCIVHGMPRSVLEAGLSTADVPLESMLAEILGRV